MVVWRSKGLLNLGSVDHSALDKLIRELSLVRLTPLSGPRDGSLTVSLLRTVGPWRDMSPAE
jgi:hypothetical protein